MSGAKPASLSVRPTWANVGRYVGIWRKEDLLPPAAALELHRDALAWLEAGRLAAKRGDCHLRGVRAFWRKLDAMAARTGRTLHRDMDKHRQNLEKTLAGFEKPRSLVPKGLRLLVSPRRR